MFFGQVSGKAQQRCNPVNRTGQCPVQKALGGVCQAPFCAPHEVVEYLGRYTHKVAISNHRLTMVDTDTVSFNYKDYRHGAKQQQLTLSHGEFIRRFAMHIFPRGFVRIRHYGILSSTAKIKSLPAIRAQLPQQWEPQAPKPRQLDPITQGLCPSCKTPTMVTIEIMPTRGPPELKGLTKIFENGTEK